MVTLVILLSPIFLLSASAAPFLDDTSAAAGAPARLPALLVDSEKHLAATTATLRTRDDAELKQEDIVIRGRDEQQEQDQQEIWTIRDMKRTCSDTDNLCEWDFVIDIGPPAPGDPGPVARRRTGESTTAAADLIISDDDAAATAAGTPPLQTTCKHLTFSSPDQGIPASRATTTTITKCGVFNVTSGWTRVDDQPAGGERAAVSVRSSPPGDVLVASTAATDDDNDDDDDCETSGGGGSGAEGYEEITDGFTVLSIVDVAKGVLVWPAYSDEEFLSGGEIGDRTYVVQDIP